MKRIIFILCFFSSVFCFSQVNDSFSDGNFTKNPVWEGDAGKFRVSEDYSIEKGAYGLQLYDPNTAGQAYLSTPSTLLRGATWEFKVFFYTFNPGNKSFLKFYLVSSQQDLTSEMNGYYLLLGGTGKNISLFRQDGVKTQLLISGNKTSLDMPQCTVLIKVTCSDTGKWTLYSKVKDEDTDWKEEGNVTDKSINESQYAGLFCKYSAGNSTLLYVDDVSIYKTADDTGGNDGGDSDTPDPDSNDKIPPTITSVTALTDSTLSIDFSEEITLKTAYFAINGEEGLIKGKKLDSNKKKCLLTLSSHLEEGLLYELLFSGIEDLNGNAIHASSELFTYHKQTMAFHNFGSVIFNEIMVNPNDVKGLPESEYIELFNRMDTLVSLNHCTLVYGGKHYLMPDLTMEPQGFVILCNQKYKELWSASGISVTGMSSFPSLLNTGKLLWLEDEQGNLISWVEYSDTWYKDSKKKNGGYSLECIDPDNLSNDISNWQATLDEKGGTPGTVNSVRNSNPDKQEIKVLSSFLQTPDTLVINFNKAMNILSLADLSHYHFSNNNFSFITALPDYPCGRSVTLILNVPLKADEKLEVELNDLSDASGNILLAPIQLQVNLPEQMEVGDILFNELLFNPRVGGTAYFELSNISDKVLSFNQLSFSLLKEDGTQTAAIVLSKTPESFPPHSEFFFTDHIALVASQYHSDISHGVEVSDFPKIPIKKGTLYLFSAQGELLDELAYSESMHTTPLKDKCGISLEKKTPELLSKESSNWASASFLSGYGTPGLPNRCSEQAPSTDKTEFQLERKSFSPTASENNKLLIIYSLLDDGFVANIHIYEASGREVCSLADSQVLSAEGTIEWDGKERSGNLSRIGLYVAYIEIHNAIGKTKTYKLPFAVIR